MNPGTLVSDPDVLAQLNGGGGPTSKPVTDPSVLAQLNGDVAKPPPKPFNVLPFSEDDKGNISFDSNAGLLGSLKRAVTAPMDVLTGKLDPMSEEGQSRAREMALAISPASAAMQAGARIIPGELGAYRRPTPTAQGLRDAAGAQYDAARATGAEYPGQNIAAAAGAAQQGLHTDGILAELAPQTHSIIRQLSEPPEGATINIASLDAARRALNRIAGNFGNPTEQEAARRVIQRIDEFIQRRGDAPPLAGAPATGDAAGANGAGIGGGAQDVARQDAARLIEDARGNSAAAFRSDRITDAEAAAELRAAASNSGRNIGNATRQRLASLLLSDTQSRGFNPLELAAIQSVVEGTAASNTLRYVSNLLGGGGGLGQSALAVTGAGIGGALGGGTGATLGATLPPALGAASRSGYNALVGRQVDRVAEGVRQRSPLYQQTPGQLVSPEQRAFLARLGLLSADQANDPLPQDLFSRP